MPHCSITFEPVGQGLFVRGRLACPGYGDLRMVFDCGVSGPQGRLDDCIANYRTMQGGPDLLIISHLHDDHVSGLPRLLDGHTCEVVILPYLSPLARAAAVAASDSMDPDFLSLAGDPEAFFLEGNQPRARRLVYITDGGKEPESGENADNPEGRPPADGQAPRDGMIQALRAAVDSMPGAFPGGSAVRKVPDSRSHRLTPCWSFRFFVRDPCKPRSRPVSAKVQAAWAAFEAEVRRVLAIAPGAEITTPALAAALMDRSKIEALRAVYQKLGNLNTNGLSAWIGRRSMGLGTTFLTEVDSGFMGLGAAETVVWVGRRTPAGRMWHSTGQTAEFCRNTGTGILLTGDADFAENGDDMADHFKAQWSSTGIIQVPHHGSRHSWDDAFFRKIWDAAPWPSFWPLNAGLLNRYGHPHQAVIRTLLHNHRVILAANHEHAAVNFEISAAPPSP